MYRNDCSKSTKARSVLALLVVGARASRPRRPRSRRIAAGRASRAPSRQPPTSLRFSPSHVPHEPIGVLVGLGNLMQLRPALDAEKR